MKEPLLIDDHSYQIKEYIINPDWDKRQPPEYFEYRKDWTKACQGFLFDKPLFLEVESTYACNYRCKACPRADSDKFNNSLNMSREILDILFDQIKEFKIPSATFSHGGEPLMRRDLPDLILRGKKSGLVDRMFHTNGFLLTEELSCELIENGLTKINFSIDAATAKTYDKLRRGGNYEKVRENIFKFIEVREKYGITHPRLRVSFVVQSENKKEMSDFYNYWKNYADVIAFQELIELEEKTDSRSVKILKHNKKTPVICTQLWQLLTVANNGDIPLCELDYKHEYILGNLKKNTLKECWNSEKMQYARECHLKGEFYKIPICKKCFKMRKYRDNAI